MENEMILATTIDEKLNLTYKNEEILKGKIVSIRRNNDLILSVTLIEGENPLRITLPFSESTLYVPKALKKVDEDGNITLSIRGKNHLKDYLGSTVSFILKELVNEEESEEESEPKFIASMISARNKTIKELATRKAPFRIKVNVILCRPNYLAVEYNGIVQTVAETYLSYSEIPSVKDFYLKHKNAINEFEVVEVNVPVRSIKLDRRPIVGDKFKQRVLTDKEYAVGDLVVGSVIGKTDNNQMLLEIEPELVALAYIPEGLKLKLNDEVKGTISSMRMKKTKMGEKRGKIFLSEVRL